ncbi:sterol desaturase family protein [Roseivirga sp. BDSF3-8]|uniref:sterol desaturase family protein n=1 Tax=Roseivirga sp. BDSF3-8 TaxID=3241598 RepID=UPI00353264F1
MQLINGVGILLLSFIGMELFSWAFHKYVMHGLLWSIHKTHHVPGKGFFELNDLFSLLFGSIAVIMIVSGISELNAWFWIGSGITLYGIVYFVLHDMIIHRRVKTDVKPGGTYLRGIAKAHRDHHKSPEKNGAVSFGLLVVAKHYFGRRK